MSASPHRPIGSLTEISPGLNDYAPSIGHDTVTNAETISAS
jgi:hypothetical protein